MDAKERRLRERLEWVEPAREGLLRALGEDIMSPRISVFPTVDPLKLILKITFRRPIAKETREPLRTYLRCWADTYSCELPVIHITDRWAQAEVLIQQRVWSRDAKGRFKGAKRFERRRDRPG